MSSLAMHMTPEEGSYLMDRAFLYLNTLTKEQDDPQEWIKALENLIACEEDCLADVRKDHADRVSSRDLEMWQFMIDSAKCLLERLKKR